MKIERNIGNVDRAVRIIAGAVLLLLMPLAFVGPQSEWAFLGLLGVFPLLTGFVGYCPRRALM